MLPTDPRDRRTRHELVSQVMLMAPQLDTRSSAFKTALVYLARIVGPNIDRVATISGCEREFVALRARRWADRGLWEVAGEVTQDELARAIEIGEGTFTEEDDSPVPAHPSRMLQDSGRSPWVGPSPRGDPLDAVWRATRATILG